MGTNADNLTQEWNFKTDLVSKNITLYAGWGIEKSNTDFAFTELANCIKITNYLSAETDTLTIPNKINDKNVLSIGSNAFENSLFTDMVFPANLTTINESAFYNCTNLGEINIPDTVTSIGKNAFWNCDDVVEVNIGSGVKTIGERAFYGCESIAATQNTKLVIPSNVLIIGNNGFCSSSATVNLKYIEFEEGLEEIGDSAFIYADAEKITLPDSLIKIDKNAFMSCGSLATVEIGKGIESIGSDAFKYIDNDSYFAIYAITPPQIDSITVFGEFTYNEDTDVKSRNNFYISVPNASLEVYKAAENWSRYAEIIIPYVITDRLN